MASQISLSLELISLLSWLLKHEKAMLNTLVKNAIERGFGPELEKLQATDETPSLESLQETLVSFLSLLESNLVKNIETIYLDHKIKNETLPTLQKIETDSIDEKTLWLSVQQTKDLVNKKTHLQQHNHQQNQRKSRGISTPQDSQKILCQQLLKNWKPTSKEVVN